MKKLLLLAFATTGLLQISFAQYQRMVMFEEFTQASCPPCASQNPAFNTLLQANEDKAVSLKYQVWWPGFDPMYLQNSPDVDNRVAYYGVTGVPNAEIDGVNIPNDCAYYEGAPACVSQTDIDNEYAITSPFYIVVTHSFNADYSTINIHVDVTAGPAVTGNLHLRVAVAEKAIYFDAPPGANGETEFYGVMKKMLPDGTGTLTGDFAAGETKSYDFAWDLSNIYDLNQVEVVAFLEDDIFKTVMQAGISNPIGGLPAIDYAVNGVSSITCSNTYDPVIAVANNTDAAVTALDVDYTIDGGTLMTYHWTGSIAAHGTGNISLPTATLTGTGSHSINVNLKAVGGAVDINMVNNNLTSSISMLDIAVPSVSEGFVATTYPPTNWALDNLSDGTGWSRATGGNVGGYGESTTSTKADFYNIAGGSIFDLYMPKMDFSSFTGDLKLVFDRAYAKYSTAYVDELKVMVSQDCGATWTTIYDKVSNDLSTAATTTSLFKPKADEWATDEIDMNAYAGASDVLVKFEGISGFGNDLYLDNINLATTTGVIDLHTLTQFSIFPNPAQGAFTASFSLTQGADVVINIYDVTGKNVASVNAGSFNAGMNATQVQVPGLATGMYQVVINAEGKNVAFENLVIGE